RALVMRQTRQAFWPCWMMAQEQRRRFGTGPLEGGVADVCAGSAQALARRVLGPHDQATLRDHSLPPWEAVKAMHVVEPRAGGDGDDPGQGLPPVQGVGV